MKWYHAGLLTVELGVMVMVGTAPTIRTLNPAVLYATKDYFSIIPKRAEAFLDKEIAIKETQLEKGKKQEVDNSFCEPEFDPAPMAIIEELAKQKKDIEKIIKALGTPCKEDKNAIYYPTDTGRIVGYDKSTGDGFYKQ